MKTTTKQQHHLVLRQTNLCCFLSLCVAIAYRSVFPEYAYLFSRIFEQMTLAVCNMSPY